MQQAAGLASILSNRRVRDKAGYVADWIGYRKIVREDIAAVRAMLEPLAAQLSAEIAASATASIISRPWPLASASEEFRRRLRERHAGLTPALELLCDCIRSGMTTESIASTLHLTHAALSKRRHRLRGKCSG